MQFDPAILKTFHIKPNRNVLIDRLVQVQIETAALDHLRRIVLDLQTEGELSDRAERLRAEGYQIIEWLRDNPD